VLHNYLTFIKADGSFQKIFNDYESNNGVVYELQ
jgi:hypothetical protein